MAPALVMACCPAFPRADRAALQTSIFFVGMLTPQGTSTEVSLVPGTQSSFRNYFFHPHQYVTVDFVLQPSYWDRVSDFEVGQRASGASDLEKFLRTHLYSRVTARYRDSLGATPVVLDGPVYLVEGALGDHGLSQPKKGRGEHYPTQLHCQLLQSMIWCDGVLNVIEEMGRNMAGTCSG